jgi:hypothetical protein
MTAQATFGFGWDFLDEMTWWALGIAFAIAIGGAFVTGQISFAVGCVVGVCLDVALVRGATHRARRTLEHGQVDPVAPLVMVVGRLVVKAALLVLALALPRVMSFPGTVVGVLSYDVTLSFVGSIVAAIRLSHDGRGKGVTQ